METNFARPQVAELAGRLLEPRCQIQVISGPRQVGKTTMALQAAENSGLPHHYASAYLPALRDGNWIDRQWQAARGLVKASDRNGAILVLDEAQKITDWSEEVKRLWDEDSRRGAPLKVVLLGSSPLLMGRGMGESLAGRLEELHLPHWSWGEMREAFGWSLDQFLFYGGYPGTVSLIQDPQRWAEYIRNSLLEPVLTSEVVLLSRIQKPALLRRVLELACLYSGQILSYTKMLGQLQDAGNTTTIAHYLELLKKAGLTAGLQKYAGDAARRRASSPKLQVFNTALISAHSEMTMEEARQDGPFWGRLAESAVGAHLLNAARTGQCQLHYWREGDREVDFVVRRRQRLAAIEVKTGRVGKMRGMQAFNKSFPDCRNLLVGGDGIELEQFLSMPVSQWL